MNFITLTSRHIGKRTIKAFGKSWFVSDFIGQILPQDVGRRVFDKGDYLAAEDNKHMKERLGK